MLPDFAPNSLPAAAYTANIWKKGCWTFGLPSLGKVMVTVLWSNPLVPMSEIIMISFSGAFAAERVCHKNVWMPGFSGVQAPGNLGAWGPVNTASAQVPAGNVARVEKAYIS